MDQLLWHASRQMVWGVVKMCGSVLRDVPCSRCNCTSLSLHTLDSTPLCCNILQLWLLFQLSATCQATRYSCVFICSCIYSCLVWAQLLTQEGASLKVALQSCILFILGRFFYWHTLHRCCSYTNHFHKIGELCGNIVKDLCKVKLPQCLTKYCTMKVYTAQLSTTPCLSLSLVGGE